MSCASRSIVRPSKGCPQVAQLFFQKQNKKEQPLAIRKIQEPPEKERFLQEQGTGEPGADSICPERARSAGLGGSGIKKKGGGNVASLHSAKSDSARVRGVEIRRMR